MNTWINFKELRASLDFEQVLRHYGVEVKRRCDQHTGFCPLPSHNGKKQSPSFSANLKRGIFQCFGCGAKGNVLEFAAHMEGVDPNNGSALREVALRLQEHFSQAQPTTPTEQRPATSRETNVSQSAGQESVAPVLVNEPLDFELKGLDASHPYLLKRGFTAETIHLFGLGFCNRGMLSGRVAIPLKDHQERLVGYAGRLVDDRAICEEHPRYRFPGPRKRNGKIYEFRKTLFLYNGFRFKAPGDDLIIVEGFTAVWWLHQCGFPHVVATMGADCSQRQAELIVSAVNRGGRVWAIPDADSAGERFAQSLFQLISPHRAVRWVKLEAEQQPTDLSAEQLKVLLRV